MEVRAFPGPVHARATLMDDQYLFVGSRNVDGRPLDWGRALENTAWAQWAGRTHFILDIAAMLLSVGITLSRTIVKGSGDPAPHLLP